MLKLPSSVKICLATAVTDMCKGHDGLSALVQQQLGQDVFSGHLFVFVSKRGDRIKILTWDHGGFVLWYNHLSSHYTSFDSRSVFSDIVHFQRSISKGVPPTALFFWRVFIRWFI